MKNHGQKKVLLNKNIQLVAISPYIDHINKVHNYPCTVCSLCPKTHDILQNHWKNGFNGEEVFCEFCGHGQYSNKAIFSHIDSKHKKGRFKQYNHS